MEKVGKWLAETREQVYCCLFCFSPLPHIHIHLLPLNEVVGNVRYPLLRKSFSALVVSLFIRR